MRKILILIGMLLASVFSAGAQTGPWSGELLVQGAKLSLVFHLDEEQPTMDSPDQGIRGIPVEVTRTATGGITIRVPSIGALYEGQWLVKQITGTFSQMGASLPLTLTPGEADTERTVPLCAGGGFFPQRRRCPERHLGLAGSMYPPYARPDYGHGQRLPEQG